MKIIIFGATGFLGSHVAEQAQLAGHRPICPIREGSDSAFLQRLGLPTPVLNIGDSDHLLSLLADADVVYNCIADTRAHASFASRAEIDVEIPKALYDLSAKAGVPRFIQLSTIMAYGFDRPSTAINEQHQLKPKYIYSKVAQAREQVLFDSYQALIDAGERAPALQILRPSNVVGSRDKDFLPNFFNSSRQGIFPTIGGGQWRFSCIDARDVGRAMLHLAELTVSEPEIYLVKGYDIDWLSFKGELEAFAGKATKQMNMPKPVIMAIGRLCEMVVPYGRSPIITRFQAEVMSYHGVFDDSKIRNSGFAHQYTLQESLADYRASKKS